MKNLLVTMLLMLLSTATVLAQTARVQIIHNAPDPTVDVYVNGVNTFDDFAFRTATGFLTLPAGIQLSIGVAPASSTSVSDVLFNFDVTFENGKTYVVTASGIVFDQDTPFTLITDANGREASAGPSIVDLSVLHGAPDAPAVDVAVRTVGNIVTDLSYGEFTPYLSVAPGDYFLDVKPAGSSTILATYRADLTGAGGQALKVMASGLLGSGTFGLYAVFADGTVAALPASPVARVQLIHNSPDPAASIVDVYKNGNLYANDVPFRGAKAFEFVPAGVPMNIGIAPANSTSVNDTIKNFNYTFENGKTYVVSVIGLTGSTATPLALNINDLGREAAANPAQVDVAVLHGSPDAPAVDVDAVYVANNLIPNLAYGTSTGYIGLTPDVYDLAVRPAGNPTVVVATFRADLSGLAGGAAYVFASGLLTGTPGFGLFAALANGTVIALPLAPAPARVQIVHNAVAPTVDVYVANTLLADNFVFRTATPFIDVAADRSLNIGIALDNSTSAADALATIPVTFESGKTYVVFASGIFAGNPGFELLAFEGREANAASGQFDVAVLHGSPDAPAVDVDAVYVADDLIDNLEYGSATAYSSLPTGIYDLAVRAHDNPAVLATFRANLGSEGAAFVFASGLLGGTPAFGLYAVFPDGTVAALPASPTARLQVIHNSPDPTVDVYVGNTRLIDNFAFRTATPFVTVLADRPLSVGVALDNSGSAADAIATFPVTLPEGGTFVAYASGVVGQTPAFDLIAVEGRESAVDVSKVELSVFHGSPDAPAVDVDAVLVAADLIDNLAYGNSTGYVALPPAVYDLAIRAHDNPNVVATFRADISSLTGGAAQVFASGFLASAPAFGIYVALPDGTVFPLPLSPAPARVQIIHDAIAPTVDVYADNTLLIDNFEFRTATPFVDVPAERPVNIGVAGGNSSSPEDALANFPLTLESGRAYVVVAGGVLAGSPGFNLFINENAREAAQNPANVEFAVFHGSPDAGPVDVRLSNGPTLFEDITFGNFTDYLSVPPAEYFVDVTPGDAPNDPFAEYRANLNGTAGVAATLFASGYRDGTAPSFEVWAALPNGVTFPLEDAVSVNELDATLDNLRLSPNPAKDEVLVQFNLNASENLRYAVRDLTGRLVQEGDMGAVSGSFSLEVNLETLVTGMYQLEIRSDAGVKTAKFVVQK
ncbi:MAG TPA: DUF4397 domain-containing protein [Saprospiraceae bacterium]|nr:DUF4397 domain-containing protein [Saprospiraceae bacterium]HPI05397.1 DUF4397 domain-containing protein [Saprospiraceae bacterium]